MRKEVIRLESVSKLIDFELVFNNMSFSINENEALGIYGATYPEAMLLIDLLCGRSVPDQGNIYINGNLFSIKKPLTNGLSLIQVVYKESRIHKNLTVAENILLGHESSFFFKRKSINAQIRDYLDNVFLDNIYGSDSISNLSQKQRYLLEIARVFSLQPSLVIFDGIDNFSLSEINTYLKPIFKNLKLRGVSVLFFSDNIDILMALSDCTAVFFQGSCISVIEKGSFNSVNLKNTVYPNTEFQESDFHQRNCLLDVRHLYGPKYINNLSFKIYDGEILGIFSQDESYYTELFALLFAITTPKHGQILMEGEELTLSSPTDAIKHKISYCAHFTPEFYFSNMSLRDNILLSSYSRLSKFGFRNYRSEDYYYDKLTTLTAINQCHANSDFDLVSASIINKSYLARALSTQPRLLLLTNPFSKSLHETESDIIDTINILSQKNISIVIASNNLLKLKTTCHRIINLSSTLDREPL
jgi:ABC-type sugar transport system ATPase subunit